MMGTLVRIRCVPGSVATNISSNSMEENRRLPAQTGSVAKYKTTSAEDAAIIIKGIEKQLKIFVGSDSKMMDKLYRLMPVKSINMMAKMINKMTFFFSS